MSAETSTWLNTNTLIGFTEKRGNAWHYRAEEQGALSNHYVGAIPVEDVRSRLFHWTPVEGDLSTSYVTVDGVTTLRPTDWKTVIRPDTGDVLGVFKSSYRIHDYDQWLIQNLDFLLHGDLRVGSAGLLRKGAVAWVQVETPDTVTTPEGVAFRPFVSAATSLDGSLSSTYQTGAQVIVCDNTLSAALNETGAARVKIKHSSKSIGRLSEVRDALGLVHKVTDDFSAQVASLCATEVSDRAWAEFLKLHVGVPADDAPARTKTIARNKWDALRSLYSNDLRVSPWKGTAFGVVQAVNTYEHHLVKPRNDVKAGERNQLRTITGKVDALDQDTLTTLHKALATV